MPEIDELLFQAAVHIQDYLHEEENSHPTSEHLIRYHLTEICRHLAPFLTDEPSQVRAEVGKCVVTRQSASN